MMARHELVTIETHRLTTATASGTLGMHCSSFPTITGASIDKVNFRRTPPMSNSASTEKKLVSAREKF